MEASTVLILSQPFHPSSEIGARRATALARYLADHGMRVVVVSAFGDRYVERGSEPYPGVIAIPVKRPKRPWLDLLVVLKRLLSRLRGPTDEVTAPAPDTTEPPRRRAALRARLHEAYFRVVLFIDHYKKWSWHAARAAVGAGRQYQAQLIVTTSPPHSTLLATAWAARRLGIPFVADLRDPWSDVLAAAYPERRTELRLLRALERSVLRRAAAITTTSAALAALLVERDRSLTDRIQVIRNGYDGEISPPLTRTGGRLSILFAGVLYEGRTPYPLLAALEQLVSRPEVDAGRVQLTLMGDKFGSFSEQSLDSWLRGKRCASVVRILPPQPAEAVAREVAQATVLLNLAQQQQLTVPAKTFEQLASGREILLICEDECETARIVSGIRGVVQVDQRDPKVLLEVLLDLYHRHVVEETAVVPPAEDVRRFSRALSHERFQTLLASLLRPRISLETPPPIEPASPDPRAVRRHDLASPARKASYSFVRHFMADARCYHRLSRANGARGRSLAWTVLSSRGLWLLTFQRIGNYCVRRRRLRSPVWWFARLLKGVGTCFSLLLCRSELSEDCEIGDRTYLSNHGYILCGARSIGAGSLIHDRCTFGYTVADGGEGRPVIGNHVWIGPNCVIAGSLTIGDGATVLPGTFLTFSVAPRAVVKGNPGVVVRENFDNSALRGSLIVVPDVAAGDS